MDNAAVQRGRRTAYPAYKPSGVEWLGDVPEHWGVDRAKWTVTGCRNGIWGEEPDGINDLPCVRVADFDRNTFRVRIDDPTMRAVTRKERRDRLLQNGDLLLEKSGGGDLQPVGAVMQYNHDIEAVCANFIARMPVADGYTSRFLAYLHAHLNAGRLNTRSIKQTTGIQNIDSQQYLNEVVVHPPFYEQKAIATFLDRETGRIDGLIAKKQRQIELLAEKRSALISHAVTKGLDPNVKMKDSGIEWLGQIPQHWQIVPLKYSLLPRGGAIKTGPFGSQLLSSDMASGDVKVYNQRNVLDRDFSSGENYISDDKHQELRSFTVFPQDVLITTRGTIGRCALLPESAERGILHPCLIRVQANPLIASPEYIALLIQDSGIVLLQLQLLSNATTIEVIYSESLKSVRLPLPPASEQAAILTYVTQEVKRHDAILSSFCCGKGF